MAKSEPLIADSGEGWDVNPDVLGVKNGIVGLRTGELRRGKREDRITMQVAVAYDPDAKCPRWDRFLGEVFIDKDGTPDIATIEFIQREVGYSLTGHTREQCLILLYGLGANGKGVFLETLLRIFAEYGDSVNFNSLMRRKVDGTAASPEIAKLRNRRFIIASEVNEGMSWDEAAIKKLTGSDTLVARYLHENPVTFRPTHKLWFGTNYKPKMCTRRQNEKLLSRTRP